MFEKTSRLKLRFDTTRGQVSAEDLWDLPLSSTRGNANLDDIAKGLYRQLQETGVVSFVSPIKMDDITQLKFDVVKHVITVRMAENEVTAQKKANADKKQQILGLISRKEEESLAGQSLDELRALANSL